MTRFKRLDKHLQQGQVIDQTFICMGIIKACGKSKGFDPVADTCDQVDVEIDPEFLPGCFQNFSIVMVCCRFHQCNAFWDQIRMAEAGEMVQHGIVKAIFTPGLMGAGVRIKSVICDPIIPKMVDMKMIAQRLCKTQHFAVVHRRSCPAEHCLKMVHAKYITLNFGIFSNTNSFHIECFIPYFKALTALLVDCRVVQNSSKNGAILNKYNLRRNVTAFYSNQTEQVRGKLAFKTRELHWLGTPHPVIVLISVQSAFHEEIKGDLKMNALLSTIRNHVKGEVTVLFSDVAHLQTMSLNHGGNLPQAFHTCLHEANALHLRYQPYLDGSRIAYWHSYICQDPIFEDSLKFMNEAYLTDASFRYLLDGDADETYEKSANYGNVDKDLFIKKARKDLLEQCACIMVLANKGYRFQFYTGNPFPSVEYVNCTFLAEEERVSWINVFLTIEKKTARAVCRTGVAG